eukprot:CAMPEP_0196601364 /NCGR_PEP_ID=MMETSP1081-20130531/95872_1 /TAXON_ID=36882 /ORGANISM="Pyramimonas amylifera, Strain CCMP720" /LENGTH=211 /DNA_ID=CAMNT_0041927239 /DNA_START=115 /DNA_END=750 /DNA_ORIENTATION=-
MGAAVSVKRKSENSKQRGNDKNHSKNSLNKNFASPAKIKIRVPLREDKAVSLTLFNKNSPEFSNSELEHFSDRFGSVASTSAGAKIEELVLFPELAGNPFAGRVLYLNDGDRDGRLSYKEFEAALLMLRRANSKPHQADIAFRIFDIDEDGLVSAEDLFLSLRHVVGKDISDHIVHLMIAQAMKGEDYMKGLKPVAFQAIINMLGLSFPSF